MPKNIGVIVKNLPTEECNDPYCPYHGHLSVRGRVFEGIVKSDKMRRTVVVERTHMWYSKKYRRYETRTSKMAAHNPPCINAKIGDKVKIAECRPISKMVSFVIIEKVEEAK